MIGAIVFVAAAAAVVYVMFGYPVLLGVLARRRAQPVIRRPIEPSVSVIIPVFNGENFLADKLASILASDYPRDKLEIMVVSDGSTDRTDAIAESFAPQGVRLIRAPRGGKPAALNLAIPRATGEILLLTDVRQTLAPDAIRVLMESFADPKTGAVSGELRIRTGQSDAEADIWRYWKFESWMRDRLSAIDSMFGATGPFYALRRELAVPIPPDTLLDDMYLPLAAFFRGYRLLVDNRARAYDYPTSLEVEFRRKVRTLAGNYQLLICYPWLLGPNNRMWLHFVSYKFGRLLLPWLLLACGVSSFWLPAPLNWIALMMQAVFYGAAALDPLAPAGARFKRISSPARTFVVMMAATVRALVVFYVPARSLWKVTSASTDGISKRAG